MAPSVSDGDSAGRRVKRAGWASPPAAGTGPQAAPRCRSTGCVFGRRYSREGHRGGVPRSQAWAPLPGRFRRSGPACQCGLLGPPGRVPPSRNPQGSRAGRTCKPDSQLEARTAGSRRMRLGVRDTLLQWVGPVTSGAMGWRGVERPPRWLAVTVGTQAGRAREAGGRGCKWKSRTFPNLEVVRKPHGCL